VYKKTFRKKESARRLLQEQLWLEEKKQNQSLRKKQNRGNLPCPGKAPVDPVKKKRRLARDLAARGGWVY